jgi:acyl-CoA thioesterase I
MFRTAFLLSIGLALLRPVAVRCATDPCPPIPEYAVPDEPLTHLAKAVNSGGPGGIDVLAVGSATTMPIGSPGLSFPMQAVADLRAALPGIVFRLTARGGRGLTAANMLPLVARALRQRHYQLVLWQTGTVDAVRGIRPEEMHDALEEGAGMIAAEGGDLVLIDPQFSRFLRANVDLEPYEQALEQVAALPGVTLFRRFDVMEQWAENGGIDMETALASVRPATHATLQACVGSALARLILAGIGR